MIIVAYLLSLFSMILNGFLFLRIKPPYSWLRQLFSHARSLFLIVMGGLGAGLGWLYHDTIAAAAGVLSVGISTVYIILMTLPQSDSDWQPPEGYARSGLAFVYLHSSACYLHDKVNLKRIVLEDASTRGHLFLPAAYAPHSPRCTRPDAKGCDLSVQASLLRDGVVCTTCKLRELEQRLLLVQWLALAGASPLREYAIHLLSQFDTEPCTMTSVQEKANPAGDPWICSGPALVEPLSQRELEVLRVLAKGRTNQEIAQQLIIAPGTVKAHTASIYRKLDVTNRTEAVARARQLGILLEPAFASQINPANKLRISLSEDASFLSAD